MNKGDVQKRSFPSAIFLRNQTNTREELIKRENDLNSVTQPNSVRVLLFSDLAH